MPFAAALMSKKIESVRNVLSLTFFRTDMSYFFKVIAFLDEMPGRLSEAFGASLPVCCRVLAYINKFCKLSPLSSLK